MSVQQVLFFVSVAFFILAVILAILAVYVFVSWNIADVHAELTGKKHIRELSERQSGRGRQSSRYRSGKLARNGSSAEPTGPIVVADSSGAAITSDEETAKKSSSSPKESSSVVTASVEPAKDPSSQNANQLANASSDSSEDAESTRLLEEEAKAETSATSDTAAEAKVATDAEDENDAAETTLLEGEDGEHTVILHGDEPECAKSEMPDGEVGLGSELEEVIGPKVETGLASEAELEEQIGLEAESCTASESEPESASESKPILAGELDKESERKNNVSEAEARGNFQIVRKIVLMESTDLIQAKQGV